MHLCLLLVLCLGCQVDLADLQYLYCKAIIIIIIIIIIKSLSAEALPCLEFAFMTTIHCSAGFRGTHTSHFPYLSSHFCTNMYPI